MWSRIGFAVVTVLLAFLLASVLPEQVADASPRINWQTISLEGVLLDQNGRPIAGADVALSAKAFNSRTKTNESGHFRLPSVPRIIVTLLITAEGFANFEQKLNPADEVTTELRIVLVPAPISEQLTVAATRTETRLGDTAASISVLGPDDLSATAATTVDDVLRQVPGFSLFRRSGSRTANPTSQGISLRGLGASGASRAIVLLDGTLLNDPFGGWIYWSRVPRASVERVEVLRGGASDLYGSSALGGVVNIITRRPETNTVSLEISYGNQLTPDASLYLVGRKGEWTATLAAQSFRTDGYVLVERNHRGLVDTAAGSRNSTINLSVERSFGENRKLFATTSFFGESRENGTPLQTNRTHIRQFTLGGDWSAATVGSLSARFYGGTQLFDQNFSAVSSDRNSETLTRVQRVPAQVIGLAGQWTRSVGSSQTMVAGVEANLVRGASDEIAFTSERPTSFVDAGGRQATIAVYFGDVIKVNSRLFISGAARVDHWRNYSAFSASRPLASPGITTTTKFFDRAEDAFSPRLSVLYKVTPLVSLTGSINRAFRAPTLNEMYRSFRVGNVLTLANENLRAERLTGGEAGLSVRSPDGNLGVRGTVFWAEVSEPVANVTLSVTPGLITRRRLNLGRTRSRGVEIETEARLPKFWNLSAGYLFADASLVSFPAQTALEGLRIPQVARHQFTFQLRYANPSVVTLGLQGRASSSQFDDDQNLFRLAPYFTLDLFVSRRMGRSVEAFVAAENLLNQRYEVGKTPVTTLGPPILVRAGLRFHHGSK
ncbi:MAG TPA: TonB-dependent receptor [Pyrinomonadaceae bacterium]